MAAYRVREYTQLMKDTGEHPAHGNIETALSIMDERGFELVTITTNGGRQFYYFREAVE